MQLRRKYEPQHIDEYVWGNSVTEAQFRGDIERGELPNIMIHGPAGTGKTSLVRVLLRELRVDPMDLLKINGSEITGKNGINDIIRSSIDKNCMGLFTGGYGKRVVWFEEADRLSPNAQDSLKAIIDDTEHRVTYIFTLNDYSGIRDPLRQRCRVTSLNAINTATCTAWLKDVCDIESLPLSDEEIQRIIATQKPSLRDMLTETERLGVQKRVAA